MNVTEPNAQVTVAPGDGRIARRPTAVLFDPTGNNADLITEFNTASSDEDAVAAVKHRLVQSEFSLAPLSMVSWGPDEVDLMAFGDTSLYSSIPSSPMITGAGSASWVERRVMSAELVDVTDIALWCGEDVDPDTDLQLGVVRGSGIRVAFDEPSVPLHEQPGFIADPSDLEAETPVVASAASAPVVDEPVVDEQAIEEPPVDKSIAGESVPAAVDPFDSAASAAGGARATTDDLDPPSSRPPMPPPPMPPPPPPMLPPRDSASFKPPEDAGVDRPIVDDPIPEVDEFTDGTPRQPDEPAVAQAGLTEALMCSTGHTNPPHNVSCGTCGEVIDGDAQAVLVEQPTVGRLVFLDGQSVPVNGKLVLGRRPVIEPGQGLCIAIDQAEVSRSHASISVDGWSAFVTDLGSRNGTFVVLPDDPTPVRLADGVQHLLEPDTTVHLGGADASFTFRGDSE